MLVALVVALVMTSVMSCKSDGQGPGTAGPKPAERYVHDPKMKETLVDVFPGMDGPDLNLTPDDIRGRVVWNLWVGDSGLMWDYLAQHGFGTADLIKTIDSRRRAKRFDEIGIIDQPGFQAASKPDQYGLFIDEPKPGDADGQIDTKIDYYTYGRSSGVIGLRISDNPNFDAAAKADWMKHVGSDGINHDYYENPSYFNNPKLARPYVVGMACSFCHVSFDPVRPPADPVNPKWENLNDYIGAQYLKVWAVFVPPNPVTGKDEVESFVWQLIHSNPPGTLDTSFIATDYLNNPGTMNGVFSLKQRLSRAPLATFKGATAGREYLKGGALDLRNISEGTQIPRVLKQGDDSVGFLGALSRVYVNIGEAWPEWKKHFNPLVGGIPQTPVPVKKMQMTSPSWNWSEERSPYLAGYLIKVAQPLLLKDAPDGAAYLTTDTNLLARGKTVFAENCAQCHSSKQPPDTIDPGSAAGKAWFTAQIQSDPAFFTDNFLSDERPHPVDVIGTNATRAAGTNAMTGQIWDNFASETYKTRAQIGPLSFLNPFDNTQIAYQMQGNGPGYYRPPSLISLWTSAPFLHNNTVGPQLSGTKVKDRVDAFNAGMDRMLLITPRENIIWRTTAPSTINIPIPYLPAVLTKAIKDHDPTAVDEVNGIVKLGPIPKGTPINLISNLNLAWWDPRVAGKTLQATAAIVEALADIKIHHLNEQQATERWKVAVPALIAANKCPDFIEDKGHLFGTKLPLSDKKALIALLKTF
jgi:mono/diheme cytochrome c family protein